MSNTPSQPVPPGLSLEPSMLPRATTQRHTNCWEITCSTAARALQRLQTSKKHPKDLQSCHLQRRSLREELRWRKEVSQDWEAAGVNAECSHRISPPPLISQGPSSPSCPVHPAPCISFSGSTTESDSNSSLVLQSSVLL